MVVFVNGIVITGYTYAASGTYSTLITFDTQYTATDWVTIVALGATTPVEYSWSTPQRQYFTYDGSSTQYPLTNSLQGTNIANMTVERDGLRLRPPEGIEYTSDGSSLGPYYLSTTAGTNQNLIADNDVLVYVDNVQSTLAVNWTLSTYDGSSDRYVAFNSNSQPADKASIKIFTTTEADYTVVNVSDLNLRVSAAENAPFTVFTYNDTAQQNILTKVYVGPTTQGITTGIAYDENDYDAGDFDETVGSTIQTNNFALGRLIENSGRLMVTLNGDRLSDTIGFTLSIEPNEADNPLPAVFLVQQMCLQ